MPRRIRLPQTLTGSGANLIIMDNRRHDPTLFRHLLIIQAVQWYVTYKLSYRDVCDLMAERGVTVVHTTVLRWVQRFVPTFEKKWKNYARPARWQSGVSSSRRRIEGRRHLACSNARPGQQILE